MARAFENGIGPPGIAVPVLSRSDTRRWFDKAIQSRLLAVKAWSSTVVSGLCASFDSMVWTCRSPVVHLPVTSATGVTGVMGVLGAGAAGALLPDGSPLPLQP